MSRVRYLNYTDLFDDVGFLNAIQEWSVSSRGTQEILFRVSIIDFATICIFDRIQNEVI